MEIADQHDLKVFEDTAQAIGSTYTHGDGTKSKAGTIGHAGATSFCPSKNLGAYGDGGAIMTNDDELAAKLRMIVNHGQSKRYYHDAIGVNSRLMPNSRIALLLSSSCNVTCVPSTLNVTLFLAKT